MFAAYAAAVDPADPLSCLGVGDLPQPSTPEDWVNVRVRAASLNHHDLWSLKGVALKADRVPMILGSDAAGVTSAASADKVECFKSAASGRALPYSRSS